MRVISDVGKDKTTGYRRGRAAGRARSAADGSRYLVVWCLYASRAEEVVGLPRNLVDELSPSEMRHAWQIRTRLGRCRRDLWARE